MAHRASDGTLCTGRKRWNWARRVDVCQKCGVHNPATLVDEPVMHLEVTPGRSACGRSLPTAGFFTDDTVIFEVRTGSRCKACWRVYASRNPGIESE